MNLGSEPIDAGTPLATRQEEGRPVARQEKRKRRGKKAMPSISFNNPSCMVSTHYISLYRKTLIRK